MAKSGAFKRKAGARRKATSTRVTATKKTRKSTKAPSPAQLAARAKFVAMVRARAAAKKKNPLFGRGSYEVMGFKKGKKGLASGRRKTVGSVKAFTRWGAQRKAKRIGKKQGMFLGATKRVRRGRGGKKKYGFSLFNPVKKNASGVVRFKSEKEYSDWLSRTKHGSKRTPAKKRSAARFKKAGVFGGSGFLGLGRSRKKISARNPRGQHLPGLPPKYQRMYEDVLASSGSKRIAAATTRAAYKRENPAYIWAPKKRRAPGHLDLAPRGKGRKAKKRYYGKGGRFGWPKSKRPIAGALSFSLHGGRKKLNPSPASVFSEFRGKDATTRTQVKAASGTPKVLAKLGTLIELHVEGKKLHFGPGASLAADGRKKLHIVGTKFARPNPPGEVEYGEIKSVTYRSIKPHIDENVVDYIHKFSVPRPKLVVDEEGYALIEGGRYSMDADGIIN